MKGVKVIVYNKAENRYHMFRTNSLIKYLNSVNHEDVEIMSLGGSRSNIWPSVLTPDDLLPVGLFISAVSASVAMLLLTFHAIGVF